MKKLVASLLAAVAVSAAHATTFTETSPTLGGAVPSGVTKVGGIVLDLRGVNGNGIVAQTAASSLYVGYAGTNPQNIGTQTGLTSGLLSALGGGLSQLAVRVTLFDGDTAAGNFDQNDNTFAINGVTIGNWSSVQAQNTDNTGVTGFSFSGGGFRDSTLDTGWFFVTNGATLASVYSSLVTLGQATYSLTDTDPFDNYYDFTQGVNSSLINSEVAPVVTANAPDGGLTVLMLGASVLGVSAIRRRRAA